MKKRIGWAGLLCLWAVLSFAQEQPVRIISLAPAITECLFALGLDKEIIAVTTFCDYPHKAVLKPKVGSITNPDFERIISMKPTLIIASGMEQEMVIEKLKQLRLPVYVIAPTTISELYESLLYLGKLTSRRKEAVALVEQLKNRAAVISEKVSKIPEKNKPRVFFEIWGDPLITAGPGSLMDELIALAGGINIAHDIGKPYSRFSTEQLFARNPDVIIMGHGARKDSFIELTKRLGWNKLKAVKTMRVYSDFDPNTILRQGPRVIEGMEMLYSRFYK